MADSRQGTKDQSTRSRESQGNTAGNKPGSIATSDRSRGMQQGERSGSPIEAMRRMSHELDRTFDRILSGWGFPAMFRAHRTWGDATEESAWMPRVEVLQKDDRFVVRAELPGLKKEDVEVNITDDAIVIQGQRRNEREEQHAGFYHSERSYGSFYRAIPLPDGVMADQAEASFENGVLEIALPAPPAEVRKGRRVEIKSGS